MLSVEHHLWPMFIRVILFAAEGEVGLNVSEGARSRMYQAGAMECVVVDIDGPLPSTPRGNRYILVEMNYFSK